MIIKIWRNRLGVIVLTSILGIHMHMERRTCVPTDVIKKAARAHCQTTANPLLEALLLLVPPPPRSHHLHRQLRQEQPLPLHPAQPQMTARQKTQQHQLRRR